MVQVTLSWLDKKTGWIEKTNIGTNDKDRSVHLTTVGDEQKLTDDDNITHTGGSDGDKTPLEGTSEHQEHTPKNLIDEDDNTQLPHVQNVLKDDDICDDLRSHQACRTADSKGSLNSSGG